MLINNELAAMRAAGVSVYRAVAPILIATLLICGLFAVFYDQVAAPAWGGVGGVVEKKSAVPQIPKCRFQGAEQPDVLHPES